MPLQETSGAASYDAFGGGAAAIPNYIEDVFSTYLIKTPGSATAVGAVNNSIDLSTKGGMVWLKDRNFAYSHTLVDSARGVTQRLISNSTAAQASTSTYGFTSFNTNGFTLGAGGGALFDNGASGTNVVTWTFRKQPKFFDIVTWTGNNSTRQISHSLGSAPGCIIVKCTSEITNWPVYHRSLGASADMRLNGTGAQDANSMWANTSPTSTVFTVSGNAEVNGSGRTYVAYLFAHNAGGFGLSGTDNVISCGSYTGNGSATGPVITLGYEPQWLLVKNTTSTGDWNLIDNMRGFVVGGTDAELNPNLTNAESTGTFVSPTATGFQINTTNAGYNTSSSTYIYIAIRRGPMKVPESGTSVYQPLTNQPLSGGLWNHNILTDFSFYHWQNGTQNWGVQDRLRGSPDLSFNATNAENGLIGGNSWDVMNGYINSNPGAGAYNSWAFRRAPGFFDVVCYTGTGANRTVTHNLTVVPEMMIVKARDKVDQWNVYTTTTGNTKVLFLSQTASASVDTVWNNTTPTSTVFSVSSSSSVNGSGYTYVAYLFATVAGVSKVGSYTGTGTTQVINCGFTAGSRFVMIKRTDSTGDWYVWDSARGIVAGNDPYVLLNSGATSVTGTDYVDTAATGFEISSTAPAAINANGGSFIFLAIA